MRYKQFLFPEENKKHEWLKITWKWIKITLGTFLFVSTLWGCGQIVGDKNVSTNYIQSIYDFQKHNIAAVFFELLIGTKGDKHHIFHLMNDGSIYEYPFNGIKNWGEAWTITKSPFYGLFVYPIAWLLVSISAGLGGKPVSVIFAIFLTTLIIKLITLVFTFKAQQNQERLQSVQMKTAEIQAKYKHSKDMQARQKMQMELMSVYKKEGINPISSFIPMILSIPFLTAMYTVVKATNLLKTTKVGLIKLIETPWSMIISGQPAYLIVVLIYLPIQLASMLTPVFLSRSRQKVKTKESKAALKKQIIIQTLLIVVFTAIVCGTPSGVGIYWIISGGLQIAQTLGFHYYNRYKKQKYKRKGSFHEPLSHKFKAKATSTMQKLKNVLKPRTKTNNAIKSG